MLKDVGTLIAGGGKTHTDNTVKQKPKLNFTWFRKAFDFSGFIEPSEEYGSAICRRC